MSQPSGTGTGSQPGISVASTSASVYRFFDTSTGTQFLTSSDSERASIVVARPDLTYEGIGLEAVVPAAGDTNAAPVFRFFDSVYGTHFYTSSAAERDSIQAARADLTYEGTAFYEDATSQTATTPVYRFFESTNGTHFYTDNPSERAAILSTRSDLVAEGIAFYEPKAA